MAEYYEGVMLYYRDPATRTFKSIPNARIYLDRSDKEKWEGKQNVIKILTSNVDTAFYQDSVWKPVKFQEWGSYGRKYKSFVHQLEGPKK